MGEINTGRNWEVPDSLGPWMMACMQCARQCHTHGTFGPWRPMELGTGGQPTSACGLDLRPGSGMSWLGPGRDSWLPGCPTAGTDGTSKQKTGRLAIARVPGS